MTQLAASLKRGALFISGVSMSAILHMVPLENEWDQVSVLLARLIMQVVLCRAQF